MNNQKPLMPKVGTLEATVLVKILKEGSCTYLDFPEDSPLHDPDTLDQVVNNLRTGMFESDEDAIIKHDA